MAADAHSSAVEADLLQRMSAFHYDLVKENEAQTTVLQNFFATVFMFLSFQNVLEDFSSCKLEDIWI